MGRGPLQNVRIMNGLDPDFGSKCPDYERRSGQKSPKMSGFLNGNSGGFSGVLLLSVSEKKSGPSFLSKNEIARNQLAQCVRGGRESVRKQGSNELYRSYITKNAYRPLRVSVHMTTSQIRSTMDERKAPIVEVTETEREGLG